MKAVITKEYAIKAVLLGACRLPKIGRELSEFSTSDLIWAENKNLISQEELSKVTGLDLPLWTLSGNGYGYGDGNGYGMKAVFDLIDK